MDKRSNQASTHVQALGSGVGKILPPTRRPDGTMRKEIRIRTGYVPQDEVPKYEARGSRPRNSGPVIPAGVDPEYWAEKQAKLNEKKATKKKQKEKSQQGSSKPSRNQQELKDVQSSLTKLSLKDSVPENQEPSPSSQPASKPDEVPELPDASNSTSAKTSGPVQTEDSVSIEKKIRALKKKVRQAETLENKIQNREATAEEKEKIAKIKLWKYDIEELEAKLS